MKRLNLIGMSGFRNDQYPVDDTVYEENVF